MRNGIIKSTVVLVSLDNVFCLSITNTMFSILNKIVLNRVFVFHVSNNY